MVVDEAPLAAEVVPLVDTIIVVDGEVDEPCVARDEGDVEVLCDTVEDADEISQSSPEKPLAQRQTNPAVD